MFEIELTHIFYSLLQRVTQNEFTNGLTWKKINKRDGN